MPIGEAGHDAIIQSAPGHALSTPLAGYVMLSLKVGADGHVTDPSKGGGSIDVPVVNDCLASVARRRSFQPPLPVGVAYVIYIFNYGHK